MASATDQTMKFLPWVILAVVIGGRSYFVRRKNRRVTQLLNEASAAMQKDDWETARQRLEVCVQQFPGAAIARRLHGRALAQLGKLDRAEDELKMAVALEPRIAEHQADLGLFCLRYKDAESGVTHLRAALQLDPTLRDRLREVPTVVEAIPEPARTEFFGV
mgnify:CR=1 FL=1